jgi:hypothetical protein
MKLFAMLATLALAAMVGLAIAGEDGVVEEDFHLRPGVEEQHVRIVSVPAPSSFVLPVALTHLHALSTGTSPSFIRHYFRFHLEDLWRYSIFGTLTESTGHWCAAQEEAGVACTFTYKCSGGTGENWKVRIAPVEANTYVCTVGRPNPPSYLLMSQFLLALEPSGTGASVKLTSADLHVHSSLMMCTVPSTHVRPCAVLLSRIVCVSCVM